jgi:hypothetical protein
MDKSFEYGVLKQVGCFIGISGEAQGKGFQRFGGLRDGVTKFQSGHFFELFLFKAKVLFLKQNGQILLNIFW